MVFARTNIEKKLHHQKRKSFYNVDILQQVREVLQNDELKTLRIREELTTHNSTSTDNKLNLELLDATRIYHINDIKKTCIDYRLRFLDSNLYKNTLPYEVISKIKQLEKLHQTKLRGYKIVGPSRVFKLKNADDPLLFVPIHNEYYYLIHKWGNDLHPLRKWMMLPFKNIENLVLTVLIMSFLLTLLIPNGMFSSQNSNSEFWLLFLFIFKMLAAIVLYYGFARGKNFNSAIWNSSYFNA